MSPADPLLHVPVTLGVQTLPEDFTFLVLVNGVPAYRHCGFGLTAEEVARVAAENLGCLLHHRVLLSVGSAHIHPVSTKDYS